MKTPIKAIKDKVLAGQTITREEALSLLQSAEPEQELFPAASEIRELFHGKKIKICAISNAKSGKCSEDCSFCAQSAHYQTGVDIYPMKSCTALLNEVETANKDYKVSSFGLVTSGKTILSTIELDALAETIRAYPSGVKRCASLGCLSYEQCVKLKAAGLENLHHNLETAASFYPKICSTHSYQDRFETLKNARKAGLNICVGGIFGLGESLEQRVEFAFELLDIDPVGIPLNFLSPIPGTPLADMPLLAPVDALKIIAMFRFVHPKRTLRICGGREKVMQGMHNMIFKAGADAIMTGNYLTTTGRVPADDHKMITELGLHY
ncbi:MAG: biotin synthase BioB [Candidatus Margulisiibacteriota bacterium]|jgi:biotin synthase